jgi:hypothetical protein
MRQYNMTNIIKSSLLGLVIVASISTTGTMSVLGQKDQKDQKDPKPEDVVERTILAYGSRPVLASIQKNGIVRSLVKFIASDGAREGKSTLRFIRKEKLSDDLMMIELELPGTKYTIGFDGKDTWEIQDGQVIEPNPENIKAFRNSREHGYEALLRYKESNSQLEYVGMHKLGTLEMDMIDLVSADGLRTRYEISRKTGRVIYASYEKPAAGDAPAVKYQLYFKNFRPIQNTLVPYETLVFQDGKVIEERKIIESVFNVQMEDKAFKAENAGKPAETAVKQ